MTFTIPERDELVWIGVDLDGTIAEPVWPNPGIGNPIRPNVRKLVELKDHGYKVVIHTSRGSEAYELIEAWLHHHRIPFDRIETGKLLARLYIDDRARNCAEDSWLPPT